MALIINRATAHFILFDGDDCEANARAFAAEASRRGLRVDSVEGPDEEVFNDEEPDTGWGVSIYGPWRNMDKAETVLTPLAAKFGGEYDGPEDMPL